MPRGMKRATRSEVYGTFCALCEAANKVNLDRIPLEDRPCAGAWKLEYATGKGYIIYADDGDGGYEYALDMKYRKSREMVDTMMFAMSVIHSIHLDNMIRVQQEAVQDAIRKASGKQTDIIETSRKVTGDKSNIGEVKRW